ncbi:hypothetical protein [Bradyrhizobium tropiciagri]|uniref:hypothetical protein n=1 Tax=Bradyrhizobium tropiciagri TaxID=312253 RepID=UPI001009C6CA|nr:hypothetical protein [Bradyrhizobium tropiciagri]
MRPFDRALRPTGLNVNGDPLVDLAGRFVPESTGLSKASSRQMVGACEPRIGYPGCNEFEFSCGDRGEAGNPVKEALDVLHDTHHPEI